VEQHGFSNAVVARTLQAAFELMATRSDGSSDAFGFGALYLLPSAVRDAHAVHAAAMAAARGSDSAGALMMLGTVVRNMSRWPWDWAIHEWMEGLMRVLGERGSVAELMVLVSDVCTAVCRQIGAVRHRGAAVRTCAWLLLQYQHDPRLFLRCLPDLCLAMTRASTSDTREEAAALVHTLMFRFPGHPEHYRPAMPFLQSVECPAPTEEQMQALLAANKPAAQPTDTARLSDKRANEAIPWASDARFRGLANLGNTCYMNAFVQALYMTEPLRDVLLSLELLEGPSIIAAIQRLFGRLHLSPRQYVRTTELHALLPPPYNGSAQQDSFEFGKLILDALEAQWPPSLGGSTQSLIQNYFYGKMAWVVECGTCGTRSSRTELFSDLPLPLERSASIEAMAHGYFRDEPLTGSEQYQCDVCRGLRDACRSKRIVQAPLVLILSAMRFGYDVVKAAPTKNCAAVTFGAAIELPVFGSREGEPPAAVRYELYAMIVHSGKSASCGHYYSYGAAGAFHSATSTREWFRFNDEKVTNCTWDDVQVAEDTFRTEVPYIWLYRRAEALQPVQRGVSAGVAELVRRSEWDPSDTLLDR
jgi:ubiquitin C-terminal hydrolase